VRNADKCDTAGQSRVLRYREISSAPDIRTLGVAWRSCAVCKRDSTDCGGDLLRAPAR